ncbi:MAG: FAD-binding protein [Acidobacteria bacterium]|nr:FAD-binding protein [Acidobacteriota bacterium]
MIVQPASIDELAEVVPAHARLRVRGGGSKPALSSPLPGVTTLDLSALTGITEHTPEECVFTALAGTPIAEIERTLAPHRQYLPFDPPLAAAGATLGGTVAAGFNGSCRYRFGGIRDFLIGARVVDGRGRVITSGGKVVKNAAGFLLHQALVGSCGTIGVLAELTFKVFPAAEAHATIGVEVGDVASAVRVVASVQRAGIDLEAIDVVPPKRVWLRLGGFRSALSTRVAILQQAIGPNAMVLYGEDDAAVWRQAADVSWAPAPASLVRVPMTLPVLPALDLCLAPTHAPRRYTIAGNLGLIAWPDTLDTLDTMLRDLGLTGQVLRGAPERPWLGALAPNAFEQRLRTVIDPDGRFAGVPAGR